jgi:hypothetical protein
VSDTTNQTPATHVAFPSIPRFNRLTIASEKVDGSNVGILIRDDGTIHAQSRKKLISVDDDFKGFARWVADNADELTRTLGYGLHFGEFWGAGMGGRKYGIAEKRFSLFNTGVWKSAFNEQVLSGIDADEADGDTRCLQAPLCHVVPVIAQGMSPFAPEVMGAVDKLRKHGSYAAPGFMRPEGVVLFHTASSSLFKVLCENDELHKSQL